MKLGLLACIVCGCGVVASAQQPAGPERPSFAEWLGGIRAEALERGIRSEIVDEALATVKEPEATVIERDRTQAEATLALETYIARQLRPATISTGRQMLGRYRTVLGRVSDRYGVPPQVIVAIWGLESNYGRFSGVRPTIAALATLAWDPRRSAFFRRELLDALQILDRGDIDVARMRGSWAGAMGQPQFMPSSYLKWAEDFDEDGRRDIWSSAPDVFASIANYLQQHGWNAEQRWGREVTISAAAARRIADEATPRNGSCLAKRNMTAALPVARWQALGVRLPGGGALPKTDFTASLVSGKSRHFLVYASYDALLDYNCAHPYALSVALLSDHLR